MDSPTPDPPSRATRRFAQWKAADRAELGEMPPEEAQAAVDAILQPRLWHVEDPRQLAPPCGLPIGERLGAESMDTFALDDLAAAFRALASAGWNAILVACRDC
jgi:hypothetical protein